MRSLLFWAFFCLPSVAHATGMYTVQNTTASGTGTSIAITLGTTPANGNLLAVYVVTSGTTSGQVSSISETGASWVNAASSNVANTNVTSEVWYAANVSSASTSVTVNLNSSLNYYAGIVEVSGVATVSPLDKATNSTASGTSYTLSTGTTSTVAQQTEYFFGGFGISVNTGSIGAPSGSFQSLAGGGSGPKGLAIYKEVGATVAAANSTSSIGGTSSNGVGSIVTFKAAANALVLAQTQTASTAAASSLGITMGVTPINGNSEFAIISDNATGTVSSISQTGATWVRADGTTNGSGPTIELWYALNISGASTSITVNMSGSVATGAVVGEYFGVATTSALDQHTTNTGSTAAETTGTTGTTASANEVYIAGCSDVASQSKTTPTNNYHYPAQAPSPGGSPAFLFFYSTATGTTSTGVTNGLGTAFACVIGTFKQVAAAASSHLMPLLGVGT